MENKIFIKNKKGFQFRSGFFAIIIVSMVVISVGLWIGEWNETYSSGLTYDLDDYDKLDEVSGSASDQKGDIQVKSAFEEGDFEGTSLRGAFGVLNNIFTPFDVVFGKGNMINDLTDRWGMPPFIGKGLVALVIITLTFALIAIFFRKPGGTA